MPEGPEIRRAADQLAKALQGKPVEHIEVGLPHLRQYVSTLIGCTVTELETRGKALLTHFDCGLSVYSHNQLYGKWVVAKRDKLLPTNRSLRLALHTEQHSVVLYSASDISVLDPIGIQEHKFLRNIGPDILSKSLTEEMIVERLNLPAFKNRSLAVLYLDQKFLAGLGNYLRSEILFTAGLHPDKKPSQLLEQQKRRLAQVTLTITQRSYKTGGYTIEPDLLNNISRVPGDYEGVRFMAFDRENEPCRICCTPIERVTRASRRLYLCPNCQ